MIYKVRFIEIIGKFIEKLGIIFLPIYWLSFLSIREKNICVCGSTFGKGFTGNPKYFYLYANSVENGLRAIWISKDDSVVRHLNNNGYESYNIFSLKGLYYALKAKTYVFDHYSKDVSFWMSGGSIKVNLWHGIPLKKGHKDNKFDIVRNPRNIWDKIRWTFRRIQNENPSYYYSVTSEYMKNLHTKAFAADYERVFVCGYARTDILVENEYLNNLENIIIQDIKFYRDIKILKGNGKKIIIYMPTHRKSEELLFHTVCFEKLNLFLKEKELILLVKAHHMSKLHNEFTKISYTNIFNIKSTEDPYPFLKMSDILITDYSSIYFDYLLMDNPIIFFPYDLDIYMRESRELYYKYEDITPGHKVTNMKELMDGIEDCIKNKDKYKQEREKVRNMMFDYIDGNSCERLYKKIIEITKGE